jgi:hypothetical protein
VKRLQRAGLAALVALVAASAHALPAAAGMTYATSDGQSGLFSYAATDKGHDIQLDGEFAGVASGDKLVEFFWCAAWSTPDATGTVLQECSLGGTPAISAWSYPGGLAVAAGSATFSLSSLPAGGLVLCSGAVATFAESVVGAASLGISACTPAPTSVPSLPDVNAVVASLSAFVTGKVDALAAGKYCSTHPCGR